MCFELGTTWCAVAKASGCVAPGIDDVTRPKFKIETPERIRNLKSPQMKSSNLKQFKLPPSPSRARQNSSEGSIEYYSIFLDFSHFLEFELQNNVRQTLPNQKLRSGSEPTLTSTFFGLLKIWVLPTARTHPSLTHNHGVRSAPTIPLAALDHTASPIRPITTKFKLPTDDMAIMNLVRYRIHR